VGLLGEVQEAQAAHRVGGVCGIKRVLETLDPADADDLRAVLDDQSNMNTIIARVLENRGITMSEQTIRRHRKGQCSCR
jgi:hypothetical protein